jgi:hypothetical protein
MYIQHLSIFAGTIFHYSLIIAVRFISMIVYPSIFKVHPDLGLAYIHHCLSLVVVKGKSAFLYYKS